MNAPKVFISYSRSDVRFARELKCRINKSAGDAWLDLDEIKPGEHWPYKTLSKLKNADYALLVLSQQSVNSNGFVREEFLAAIEEMQWRKGDYILLFKTDDCEIPEPLRKIHCVGMRDNGIDQIIHAMGLIPVKPSKCKSNLGVWLTILALLALLATAYWLLSPV